MSENPFFEFVGAPSYAHSDKQKRVETEFKHFSQKHDKQYENEQEIARRKSIFNHNYRYVVLSCVQYVYTSLHVHTIFPQIEAYVYFLRDIYDPASKQGQPLFGSRPLFSYSMYYECQ